MKWELHTSLQSINFKKWTKKIQTITFKKWTLRRKLHLEIIIKHIKPCETLLLSMKCHAMHAYINLSFHDQKINYQKKKNMIPFGLHLLRDLKRLLPYSKHLQPHFKTVNNFLQSACLDHYKNIKKKFVQPGIQIFALPYMISCSVYAHNWKENIRKPFTVRFFKNCVV